VDPLSENGAERAIRGGAWNVTAANCRIANRLAADPALRQNALGFRLMRVAE
jgi:formylglycine-generating enzyme required for sulfatase activity